MTILADQIRTGYGAFAQGETGRILALLTEDVEWSYLGQRDRETPYDGTWRGRLGVKTFFERLSASEEILEFRPLEFLAGPTHMVVIGRLRARGRCGSPMHTSRWIHVLSWRGRGDDRISRWIGSVSPWENAAGQSSSTIHRADVDAGVHKNGWTSLASA